MYTTIKIIDEITGQATTNAPLYYEGPLGKPFESKINASFYRNTLVAHVLRFLQ